MRRKYVLVLGKSLINQDASLMTGRLNRYHRLANKLGASLETTRPGAKLLMLRGRRMAIFSVLAKPIWPFKRGRSDRLDQAHFCKGAVYKMMAIREIFERNGI